MGQGSNSACVLITYLTTCPASSSLILARCGLQAATAAAGPKALIGLFNNPAGGYTGYRMDFITLLHPSMGHSEVLALVTKRSLNATIAGELRQFTQRNEGCEKQCLHHSLQPGQNMCGEGCLSPL